MANYISQIQLSDNLIYDITLPGLVATVDQLNSLSGVTQDLQTQLNNKWDKETDIVSIEAGGTGVTTLEELQNIILGGSTNTYILNQASVIENNHIVDGTISAEKLDSSIGLIVASPTEPTARSCIACLRITNIYTHK